MAVINNDKPFIVPDGISDTTKGDVGFVMFMILMESFFTARA